MITYPTRSKRIECSHLSITEFRNRPLASRMERHEEHVLAYQVAKRLEAGVSKCEAGKPLLAMKWWQADYRNGKRGW